MTSQLAVNPATGHRSHEPHERRVWTVVLAQPDKNAFGGSLVNEDYHGYEECLEINGDRKLLILMALWTLLERARGQLPRAVPRG